MHYGVAIFFSVLVLGLSACDSSEDSRLNPGNTNGIKFDKILIGSSLALKEHAGYLGTQMLQGALSYINKVIYSLINFIARIKNRGIEVSIKGLSYNYICFFQMAGLHRTVDIYEMEPDEQ